MVISKIIKGAISVNAIQEKKYAALKSATLIAQMALLTIHGDVNCVSADLLLLRPWSVRQLDVIKSARLAYRRMILVVTYAYVPQVRAADILTAPLVPVVICIVHMVSWKIVKVVIYANVQRKILAITLEGLDSATEKTKGIHQETTAEWDQCAPCIAQMDSKQMPKDVIRVSAVMFNLAENQRSYQQIQKFQPSRLLAQF
jgi:hypothetical protein